MVKRPRARSGGNDRKARRSERSPTKRQVPPRTAAPVSARQSSPAKAQPAISQPAAVVDPPASTGPCNEALTLFTHACEQLQRHRYRDASAILGRIAQEFPDEGILLDRVRVYQDLCARELRKGPVEPHTLEERLTAATAALNDGDVVRAERHARDVLSENPRDDMALYLLASIECRRGAVDKALSYLGQAIALSPEARAQARHEPDFEPLRNHPVFQELTDLAGVDDGPRRARKSRPER
jgi:tetratricopeptide (TPR) repeat protein